MTVPHFVWVIYLTETDGDTRAMEMDERDVAGFVERHRLTPHDYAVFEGKLRKDFHVPRHFKP